VYLEHLQVRRLRRLTHSMACCSGKTLPPAARRGRLQGARPTRLPRPGAQWRCGTRCAATVGAPAAVVKPRRTAAAASTRSLTVAEAKELERLSHHTYHTSGCAMLAAHQPHCRRLTGSVSREEYGDQLTGTAPVCRVRSCAQLLTEVQAAMQERGMQLRSARQAGPSGAAAGGRVTA
jgi:hypothetical protein